MKNVVGIFLLGVGVAYLAGSIGSREVSYIFSIPGLVFGTTGVTTLIQK